MCQDDLCCGAISVLGGLLDGPGILVVVGSNGGHCGRRGDGDTRQSLLALVVRGGVSSLNSMPVLQQNAIIRPSERRQCERERERVGELKTASAAQKRVFLAFFILLLLSPPSTHTHSTHCVSRLSMAESLFCFARSKELAAAAAAVFFSLQSVEVLTAAAAASRLWRMWRNLERPSAREVISKGLCMGGQQW